MALEGWYRGALDPARRLALLVASILLLYPPNYELFGLGGWTVSAIGALLTAVIVVPRILAVGAKPREVAQ